MWLLNASRRAKEKAMAVFYKSYKGVDESSFEITSLWRAVVQQSIAIFFEVRPIHACTLAPLWTVRPTSGNRRRIALATQGARSVTAVSCPPDPCKKIRHLPSQ